MLLIAVPKSASTSLVHTIAQIGKLDCGEGVPKKSYEIDCEGFPEIQKYHSNMIERSSLFIRNTSLGKKKIFKEHLLPTIRHLKIIEKLKIKAIILLRNPTDILDSYLRMPKGFSFHSKQLAVDILNFVNLYVKWALDKPNLLVVYYCDLILNYNNTMKRILKHYSIKIPKKIPALLKIKYTGVGRKRLCC